MKYAIQLRYNDCFEYALRCAKNAGFKYVSLAFNNDGWLSNSDWQSEVLKIDRLLHKNSVECIQTHLPYYDLRISSEIIDEALDRAMLNVIELGAKLGAEWNVYHARTAVNENYSPRKSMELAKAAIEPLANKASLCKSGLAIENLPIFPGWVHGRMFTSDYEDLCELCDFFNSEFVSVCWDFGHANLMGNNQEKAISYVGKRIQCTHLHNNDGSEDYHYLPSQGNIDWKTVIGALKKTGYDNTLTLEIIYDNVPYLEGYFRHSCECLEYIDNL